ncbi:hypothetical protein [Devosia sp.]|uniref:hypothetical protein n=1 Tax=Devosia sp. TaxID=1871048 RepID=UPI003262DBD9
MSDGPVDFAIFGSDPLAQLLAGLLASQHRQRIVLISADRSVFGLNSAMDLSIGAFTRPETWALLRQAVSETTKLLVRIGAKAGIERIDPVLFAETAEGKQALAYIRHVAHGFGQHVERLATGAMGMDRDGILFRDAIWLDRARTQPMLSTWLQRNGVKRLAASKVQVTFNSSGGAEIATEGNTLRAERAVLADDNSIITMVAKTLFGQQLRQYASTVLLTEPAGPLLAPVMMQIDRALTLSQGPTRAVAALVAAGADDALAQAGGLLANHAHLRLAGLGKFQHLRTGDGAQFIGRLQFGGPEIIAGMGPTGAFMAPALARWLAGSASAEESGYFGHRDVRDNAGSLVADYAPGLAP